MLFDNKVINDYKHALPLVQRIINTSVSVRTGFAPSQLLFAKALDLDRGIFVPELERTKDTIPVSDYVRNLMNLQDNLLKNC